MANWTSTTYKFLGTTEDIKKLHDAVNYAKTIQNGWIGHVLQQLDVSNDDTKEMSLRGFITFVYEIETKADNLSEFQFEADEAWYTCQDFHDKIKELFPDLTCDYMCEEWGCEIFERTEGFDAKFAVYNSRSGDYDTIFSDEGLKSWIECYSGKKFDTLTDALDYVVEYNEDNDNFIDIHEYEVMDF